MDQIAGCSQLDGPSRGPRLQMHIGNTAGKHVASFSTTQGPVTAQEPVTAQTKEGDGNPPRYTMGEDEIDIWLKLSPQIKSEFKKRWPQVYMAVEQHVQEQAKQGPGSTISASSAAAEPNTSYEEQLQRPIADQVGAIGVNPRLTAQGPSNHSQVKKSAMEHQTTMGNGRESLYGFPPIREGTTTSTAASQGNTVQNTESYQPYNLSHSFDRGSSQTQSDSEMEEIEAPPSCRGGRSCCHDGDCRLGARVPLQYPGPGENTRPERLFDVGRIGETTQATIYRCRSPKRQVPNCQEYHIADRDKTRAGSQHPLGSVSQGYYNTMRNGIDPSNMYRQTVANGAVNSVQSYPSLKGKHIEPEQLYKSAPQEAPSNPVHQYWTQYGKTSSANNQAPVALHQQDVDEIAALRANLRQGDHLQNCYLYKPGIKTNQKNPTVCHECWKKLEAAEGLMLFWNNPVVHPRSVHQARAMARVTSKVPPPAQVASQTERGGKGKAPVALEPPVTRKAEPKPHGSGFRNKNIDQACPHEQQEVERQQIGAEQISFQQLLPEVNIEQGRISLA